MRVRVSVVAGGTMAMVIFMLMFVVVAMFMLMFVIMTMFMLVLFFVVVAVSVIVTMFMPMIMTVSMFMSMIVIVITVIVTVRTATIRCMRMCMLSMWLEHTVDLINDTMPITTAHSKEEKIANIEDQTYEGSQEHYFWIKCKSFTPV